MATTEKKNIFIEGIEFSQVGFKKFKKKDFTETFTKLKDASKLPKRFDVDKAWEALEKAYGK